MVDFIQIKEPSPCYLAKIVTSRAKLSLLLVILFNQSNQTY